MKILSTLRWFAVLAMAGNVFGAEQSSEPVRIELGFQESRPSPFWHGYLQFAGYHDSRCPQKVACGVAGEAYALLWLAGEGNRGRVVVLPWTGGAMEWRHAVRAGKHEYLLVSLEPRPLTEGMVNPAQYRLVVAVRPRRP